MNGVLAPGVWRLQVRCVPGTTASFVVADTELASEAWAACADIVLTGGYSSSAEATAAVRRRAVDFPGAVAIVAWCRETTVFARLDVRGRCPSVIRSALAAEFGRTRVPQAGIQVPGFGPMRARLIEVVVAGLQVGQDGEDFSGVER